ncbi:MAG: hypothetical protein LIQ30_02290 [Planctomycetes bacterium]|nr:hypothetical protein [Planctomycetota bacterium]MCD7896681.1 hypothetical protein [Planctomycetaceae bacterium]
MGVVRFSEEVEEIDAFRGDVPGLFDNVPGGFVGAEFIVGEGEVGPGVDEIRVVLDG